MNYILIFIVPCLFWACSVHSLNLISTSQIPFSTRALIACCNVSSFFCSFDPQVISDDWNRTVKFNRLSEVGKQCLNSSSLKQAFNFSIKMEKPNSSLNLIWYRSYDVRDIDDAGLFYSTDLSYETWLNSEVEIDDCGVEGGDGESCKDCLGVVNGNAKLSPDGSCKTPYPYFVPEGIARPFFLLLVNIS